MRGQPLALNAAGVASARFGPAQEKSAMLYTRHPFWDQLQNMSGIGWVLDHFS